MSEFPSKWEWFRDAYKYLCGLRRKHFDDSEEAIARIWYNEHRHVHQDILEAAFRAVHTTSSSKFMPNERAFAECIKAEVDRRAQWDRIRQNTAEAASDERITERGRWLLHMIFAEGGIMERCRAARQPYSDTQINRMFDKMEMEDPGADIPF